MHSGQDPEGEMEMAILNAALNWPRPNVSRDFQYGTAGFRMRADLLDFVIFTVGVLAGLRSRKCYSSTIGVMITASHNPAEDNGVKLVDPMGEMLEQDWEIWATRFANAPSAETLRNAYCNAVDHLKVEQQRPARVIFARDTRPSGERLVKALKAGLDAAGAEYIDYGIATTPQLHYLVRATNTQNQPHPYGEVSLEGYYKKIAGAFEQAMKYTAADGPVTVDCANGVGAPKLRELIKYLPKDKLVIRVVNDKIEDPEELNSKCGADYVKTRQAAPLAFDGKNYDRWASLDGDADRIVYYFQSEGHQFRLLDGDRIATLAAGFIGDLVRRAGLDEKIKLAVVQTAYANGSATKYVEQNLKLKVECTPTGVKHLHHVAARYDIGVYFEANGHGTVLFSEAALKAIRKHEPESPGQLESLAMLSALADLINQTVGDALSDLLLVEVVLAHKQWTVKEWLGTYTDLPNKLAKIIVQDRNNYRTIPGTAERKLERPPGVQEKVDQEVAKYKEGRCFVRASGTEDAVRIYGEASDTFEVEDMVAKVSTIIHRNSAGSPIEEAFAIQKFRRADQEHDQGLQRANDRTPNPPGPLPPRTGGL